MAEIARLGAPAVPVLALADALMAEDAIVGDYLRFDGLYLYRCRSDDKRWTGMALVKDAQAGSHVTIFSNGAVSPNIEADNAPRSTAD